MAWGWKNAEEQKLKGSSSMNWVPLCVGSLAGGYSCSTRHQFGFELLCQSDFFELDWFCMLLRIPLKLQVRVLKWLVTQQIWQFDHSLWLSFSLSFSFPFGPHKGFPFPSLLCQTREMYYREGERERMREKERCKLMNWREALAEMYEGLSLSLSLSLSPPLSPVWTPNNGLTSFASLPLFGLMEGG